MLRRNFYLHSPSFCEQLCTFVLVINALQTTFCKTPYLESVLKMEFVSWFIFSISNQQSFSRAESRMQKAEKQTKRTSSRWWNSPFFSPENLRILLEGIFSTVEIAENPEFFFRRSPNNTTKVHFANFVWFRL